MAVADERGTAREVVARELELVVGCARRLVLSGCLVWQKEAKAKQTTTMAGRIAKPRME